MNAFEITATADAVHLSLNGELTIQHAKALHSALTAALLPTHLLRVDAGTLTRIDAAGLQVLLAASRIASRAGLAAPCPVWTAACQRHGIADPFIQP